MYALGHSISVNLPHNNRFLLSVFKLSGSCARKLWSSPPLVHSNDGKDSGGIGRSSSSKDVLSKVDGSQGTELFHSDVEDLKQLGRPGDVTKYAFRPNHVHPSTTSVLLFPGQGSQYVGMCKNFLEYPGVRNLYERGSHIYNFDLLKLSLNGPADTLNKTYYSQPLVFLSSLAALAKLEKEHPDAVENCVGVAGFSVGEYAALVFANVLDFEDAMSIIKERSMAMQKASEDVSSGMMTVHLTHAHKLRFGLQAAKAYCKERKEIPYPVLSVASHLTTDIKVIAGHVEALHFFKVNSKEFGVRCKSFLPVSGAFHTHLMKPAAELLVDMFTKVPVRDPIVPVHSNVDGKSRPQGEAIKKLLLQQMWKPIAWEQTMHILFSRRQSTAFPRAYEVGPQKQLGSLLSKVNAKAYEMYTALDS